MTEAARDGAIVAIDVGSSSARAIVYDAEGNALPDMESHRPYAMVTDDSGAVEVDADMLVELVSQCLDDVVAKVAETTLTVHAVACCTFWHSLLGTDEQLRAQTPVYTWADTRSRRAASELKARVDEHAVHQRTGALIHSSYPPAKLRWLRQDHPDLFGKVKYWMSFAEYLYCRVFRRRCVSISMASGTGMFDQHRCVWDADMLRVLGISEESLSPIREYTETMKEPLPDLQARWPALAHASWYLPLGDGACSNIGSGGVDERTIVAMVGTSGAMRVVRKTDTFKVPSGLWTYRIDRARIIQGGALSEGGNTFAWLAHTLAAPLDADFERRVRDMEPDEHGLTILPFFAGERSPNWRSDARATIHGITLATTAEDVVRATLEAVALRFVLVHRRLIEAVPSARTIVASGEALSRSQAWAQILTDALGWPLTLSTRKEATSRGAALLALEALHGQDCVAAAEVARGATTRPDERRRAIYDAALDRQEALDRAMRVFHADTRTPE